MNEFVAAPLRPGVLEDFRWFCQTRRALDEAAGNRPAVDLNRYSSARRAFGAPRFYAAYRAWRERGDAALNELLSPRLHDTWTRGDGRLDIAAGIAIPLITAMFWMRSEHRVLPTATIERPGGTIVVEIAATPASRLAGLSNRETLRGIDGMLLKWDAPGRHPIWMKGMRLPLDLLWLDTDRRVIGVLENVPPCSADPCPLYEPSSSDRSVAVLELPAKAAAQHGLAVGASVGIRGIPQPR